MPVAVSRARLETPADDAANGSDGRRPPAFPSPYPFGPDNAEAWNRMAEQVRAVSEMVARHWRALAEVPMHAAIEVLSASMSLAATQSDLRRATPIQMMENRWPTLAAARAKEENAYV